MGAGVIVLCFVALGLQLGMGSNANVPDDEDYYSGSGSGSGKCTLNVAAVCCKSVINIIATMKTSRTQTPYIIVFTLKNFGERPDSIAACRFLLQGRR